MGLFDNCIGNMENELYVDAQDGRHKSMTAFTNEDTDSCMH